MPTENEMRAAIAARDMGYDGRFVFGVITTGVFCRPSCAARPALPENIRFFVDAEAASLAQLRPCKRCRPTEAASNISQFVSIARFIEAHADETLTLAHLAEQAGLSVSRFQRVFKAAFGVSPKVFQDAVRMRGLKAALKTGDGIAGAIFEAGFGSTSRVYGEAARNIGMTPSVYRAGGKGETINYVYRESVLGSLLLAATNRGVCFAQFGVDEETLVKQLQAEFPKAEVRLSPADNSPELDSWMDALNAHISHGGPRPDLPLDLQGTAFQILVWRFLLGIDEGKVVSYGELAKGINKPRAVRAAASACGANRIAVLVPCHRVLRGDGGLGGYRWGAERKRSLLAAERSRAAKSPL